MSITLSIDLNSIYYLPDWVCHPTIIDRPFLFHREGAEQGRGEWGKVQRRHPWDKGVLQQRDRFARSAIEVRCSRCEAPHPPSYNDFDNDLINNDLIPNNDLSPEHDNLNDGTEDTNHNGRIDGDNGDGIYQDTETWEETNPNDDDTDGDTFKDDDEIEWKYDPKKADTDSDGINDNVEDVNGDGSYDSSEYSGETNPREMDSDGDGLLDKQEKDGWVVVIIRESTGEQITRRDVFSNPRLKDSDDDQIDDFSEFKNATDPKNTDTDGDGKDDYVEIIEYEESSPWGIDGTPPEIIDIEKDYDIKWGGLFGVIPEGVELKLKITARDDFGMKWINVWVEKLGEKKVYFSDEQEVTSIYNFDIESDDASNFLYKGFKINVSAMDRNDNLGFKNVKMPGITEMVMDALLGPLLSIIKIITELISSACKWLYDLPKDLLNNLISQAKSFIDDITNKLKSSMAPLKDYLTNEGTKGGVQDFIYGLFDSIFQIPFALLIALILVTILVIELIVTGVSLGAAGIISAVLSIVISVVAVVICTQEESKDAVFGFIENTCDDIANFFGTEVEIVFVILEQLLLGILGFLIGLFSLTSVYGMTVGTQGSQAYAFLHYELDIVLTEGFKNAIFWSIISIIFSVISALFINSVEKPLEKIGEFTLGIFFLILSGISSAFAIFFAGSRIASGWQKVFNFGCSFASIAFTIATFAQIIMKYGFNIDPENFLTG